jgi:hypothetical protein
MIILSGLGSNGKTKLMNDIENYVGTYNCHRCSLKGDAFFKPIKKLVLIHECLDMYDKNYVQQLHNVITYKQSVISCTNNMNSVSLSLINTSKIIHMTHTF